jgi:hypothetical protein
MRRAPRLHGWARVQFVLESSWRWLLMGAACALVIAALATAAGVDAVSHIAGIAAWASALAGGGAGLACGTGRRASS